MSGIQELPGFGYQRQWTSPWDSGSPVGSGAEGSSWQGLSQLSRGALVGQDPEHLPAECHQHRVPSLRLYHPATGTRWTLRLTVWPGTQPHSPGT